MLIAALAGAGTVLGVAGGLYTRIRVLDGRLMIKAGAVSAILWVLGMGPAWASRGPRGALSVPCTDGDLA